MATDADVVIVGAGLAGLVAACELAEAKRSHNATCAVGMVIAPQLDAD